MKALRFLRYALFFGFGFFLSEIGYGFNTWQFWVALGFVIAIQVVSLMEES